MITSAPGIEYLACDTHAVPPPPLKKPGRNKSYIHSARSREAQL